MVNKLGPGTIVLRSRVAVNRARFQRIAGNIGMTLAMTARPPSVSTLAWSHVLPQALLSLPINVQSEGLFACAVLSNRLGTLASMHNADASVPACIELQTGEPYT